MSLTFVFEGKHIHIRIHLSKNIYVKKIRIFLRLTWEKLEKYFSCMMTSEYLHFLISFVDRISKSSKWK